MAPPVGNGQSLFFLFIISLFIERFIVQCCVIGRFSNKRASCFSTFNSDLAFSLDLVIALNVSLLTPVRI